MKLSRVLRRAKKIWLSGHREHRGSVGSLSIHSAVQSSATHTEEGNKALAILYRFGFDPIDESEFDRAIAFAKKGEV